MDYSLTPKGRMVVEQAIKAFEDGKTVEEIAAEHGVEVIDIQLLVAMAGIEDGTNW